MVVFASYDALEVGEVRICEAQQPDGSVVEVPAMILRETTQEDFLKSREERGIAHLPSLYRITPDVRFYVCSVD